jgi:hypothetical protein
MEHFNGLDSIQLLTTVLETRINSRVLAISSMSNTNNMSVDVRRPLVLLAHYVRSCISKGELISPHVISRILNLVLTPPTDFELYNNALHTFRQDSIAFCEAVMQPQASLTTNQVVPFFQAHSRSSLNRTTWTSDEYQYTVALPNGSVILRSLPPSLEAYLNDIRSEVQIPYESQSTDMELVSTNDVEVECDDTEEILDPLIHITNSLASLTQTIAILQETMLSMHCHMSKSEAIQLKQNEKFSLALSGIRESSRKVQAGNIANRAKLNLPFYLKKNSIERSNLKSYNHDPRTGTITGVTLHNAWTQNLSGGAMSTL